MRWVWMWAALVAPFAAVAQTAQGNEAGAATCLEQAVVLPDPAECLRSYRREPDGDMLATLTALYERSVELQNKGEFAAAAAVLDCAESAAGAHPAAAIEHELLRRRGVLDYRRECPAQALEKFKRALKLAERNEDRPAQSKTWNNIGSALRRLGDYRGALQALMTSLELQRGLPQAEAGKTLNNIADIYRDLGENANAIRHYDQARAEFLRDGNKAEAGHVLSSLGVLALNNGELQRGESLLTQARDELVQAGDKKYLMRTYSELGRAAIERGDVAAAKRWTDSGLAIAAQDAKTIVPAPLQLQAARGDRLRGQARAAQQRMSQALNALAVQDSDRPDLLAELARDFEALGEWPQAMAALRESEDAARALREARYDREMKWMQLRFETAERDRTIAALATQNQVRALSLKQRTLALWLTVVSALAALLGLTVFFLRRQHRARVAEAARQARLAEEVDYYRRAAAELGVDRARLQAALDSRDDAVLVLDAGGQVLAANRSAGELLQPSQAAPLAGRAFGELLDEPDALRFAQALEHLDESSAPQGFDFRLGAQAEPLRAQLSESGQGEGLIVLGLKSSAAHDAATTAGENAGADPLGVEAPAMADEELRLSFRRALVELMLAVVEAWERSTGQGRLELAEKSRIWRVTVDDGRLRARAMERYLSLSKLPRQPRWRDVLRSGYYVLAECALEEPVRDELQRHVDAVLAYTRRHALV
ncbi:tetratricopeptide repeat protein [Lysobacter gummosus]|uniref:tetratricopeptide repeat protein n=1 Tax=Lysobacter gummosus TaxID=262324 RepID=UPI003637D4CF